MSTKSIGEEGGCCTVIQDYLINARKMQGETAGNPVVQYSIYNSVRKAICEKISCFSSEWVMLL